MINSTVLKKIYSEPPFNKSEILRYAGCSNRPDEVLTLINECINEVKGKLTYSVCYKEFPITFLEDKIDLTIAVTKSTGLRKNLKGCKSILLFAATVGLQMDRLISKYSRLSPAKALIMQAIGAERIESLCDLFCDSILKDLGKENCSLKPRFSPGYGDLPLALQKDIFACLDCNRQIGLSLSNSLLMTPTKSVTAIAGITDKADCTEDKSCNECNLESCPFRRNQ